MVRNGIQEISSEQLDRTFKTNIYAMFWLCQAALPHMQPGACIINTCSKESFHPKPSLLDYATTKGAIVTFSKALATEVMPQGIRVNVVAPGPVWTPLIPTTYPPEQAVSGFGQSQPIGRPAQPVEVSLAYVFLASQEAGYISGEVIRGRRRAATHLEPPRFRGRSSQRALSVCVCLLWREAFRVVECLA